MKDRIEIFQKVNIKDALGFKINKEVSYYSCWANKQLNSGKETWGKYSKQSIIVVSFKVRACKKLQALNSKDYFIKHKGKVYDIIYIDDTNVDYYYIKAQLSE